jgi:hypothetical protein
MIQNRFITAGLVSILVKCNIIEALAVGETAPGNGWYYSGDGGYENLCPISPCANDCTLGNYRFGCYSNSSGTCVSCNNKPDNSYYITKGNFESDCTWVCDSGFIQSGSICIENSKCTKSIPMNSAYSNTAYPNCDHKCNAGYFNLETATNPTACTACQAGQYSSQGATACTLCSAGTFSNYVGSPGKVNCLPCSTGTYSTNSGASQSDVCVSCQAGTYSTAFGADTASTCHACPEGTYSTSIGANTEEICSMCVAGKYTGIAGMLACVDCDAGTYAANTGTSKCTVCPTNSYTSTAGMVSCKPCEYCNEPGIYRNGCGPVSSGYCTACTNAAVQ